MKQINDYITEKFKINSKTVKTKDGLNINFDYDDCNFEKSDYDKIIKFIKELPILPEEVVCSDQGNTIVLKYPNTGNDFVRIYILEEYKVGFRETVDVNVKFYGNSNGFNNIDSL